MPKEKVLVCKELRESAEHAVFAAERIGMRHIDLSVHLLDPCGGIEAGPIEIVYPKRGVQSMIPHFLERPGVGVLHEGSVDEAIRF